MEQYQDGVAIVGMSCKFPGSNSLKEYWNNLIQNNETIHFFTDDELKDFEYDFENIKNKSNYVKARGRIEDIDKWDANFFNTTPHDAEILDPQQRLWLSNTWHAFEDAGINPFDYNGKIGVYAGSVANTYLLNNVLRDPEKYELYLRTRTPEIFQTYIENEPMFLATRTAYFYNLKGTAISLQTACSTSLVAVTQACNSLFSHESDVCIAGGVTITVPQETGYFYLEGAIQSPDGHCKPFDKDSKGTVFANGVGTVVLKRLEDAVKDNDRIYAVLRGWATNNDGHAKIGFTAPSIDGQKDAISAAYSFADINAGDICYVEGHGTATPLGDPIEVKALSNAFRETTDKKQFCGLGSVKSNFGHLDAAAGIAGLIKVALSAYNKVIPATLHYKEPNPLINIKETPFFVVDKNIEWTENKTMNMGVSSFGVGGTNAHVILSSFQKENTEPAIEKKNVPALYVLSAKSDKSLVEMQENLTNFLEENKDKNKHQLAHSLQFRRAHFPYRAFTISGREAGTILSRFSKFEFDEVENSIVFLFPGQGAQYINMGKSIYSTEEICRQIMDECFSVYQSITGSDIKPIIFDETAQEDNQLLAETRYTQPALFIIEYAMAQLFMHYGIKPAYCLGHSIGEYTAACVSGVFDLETALKIVIKRGQLMYDAPKGKMMAIPVSEQELLALESDLFEIAAINSPTMISISYTEENEKELLQILDSKNYNYIQLNTSHGFHSEAFEPIMKEFADYVDSFSLKEPIVPFISCLTGDFITHEQATSGNYWSLQLRNTVLFSKGIKKLSKINNPLFIEVGPNTHLRGLVVQNEAVERRDKIICSLGKINDFTDQERFYQSLGELWIRGVEVDLSKFYDAIPEHISLPPYSFEKNRYWIDFKLGEGNKQLHKEVTHLKEKVVNDKKLNKVNTLDMLTDVLSNVTGISQEKLTVDKSFQEMNIESLAVARLAVEIEKHFDIKLLFRDLVTECNTLNKLAEYINTNKIINNVDNERDSHLNNLVLRQANGSKTPLIIVYAEGLFQHNLVDLNVDRKIYNYFDTGSDGEKIPFKTVKEMAKDHVNQLLEYETKGPLYIGGFSFGGILAYEMAMQLKEKGIETLGLFLVDCNNPSVPDNSINQKRLKKEWKSSLKLISSYLKRHYIDKLRCSFYFALNKSIPVGLRHSYIRNKYISLMNSYTPKETNKNILLFRAKDNLHFSKNLGWDKVVKDIKVVELKGHHLNLFDTKEKASVLWTNIMDFIQSIEKR